MERQRLLSHCFHLFSILTADITSDSLHTYTPSPFNAKMDSQTVRPKDGGGKGAVSGFRLHINLKLITMNT